MKIYKLIIFCCLCLANQAYALTCQKAMSTEWHGKISGYQWIQINFIAPDKVSLNFNKEISGRGGFIAEGSCTENPDGSITLALHKYTRAMHASFSGIMLQTKKNRLQLNFSFYYGSIVHENADGSGILYQHG